MTWMKTVKMISSLTLIRNWVRLNLGKDPKMSFSQGTTGYISHMLHIHIIWYGHAACHKIWHMPYGTMTLYYSIVWTFNWVLIRTLVITTVIALGFCVVKLWLILTTHILLVDHGFQSPWMCSKWVQIIMRKLRFTIWKQWSWSLKLIKIWKLTSNLISIMTSGTSLQ